MAARLKSQGRHTRAALGEKMTLSQHVQELHSVIALQERGRKFFTQSCEERLLQRREQLPDLREALQEATHALHLAQKPRMGLSCAQGRQLTGPKAGRAEKGLGIALAGRTVEVAQEKLQAEIYNQINTCNLLQDRMRQQSQARDRLQRWLQQLQDAELDRKEVQVIHQLENNIEKMHMKIHAGQRMKDLYLVVQDVLKKELAHLHLHLDLMCESAKRYRGELEDMELMVSDALKAAHITKEDIAKMETQFLAERELRCSSLAAQKVNVNRLWLKELSKRRSRARSELAMDFATLNLQDPLLDADMEATKLQQEYEAWVTEKMESAKDVAQCSCIWDIPSRLLAQQKSLVGLEQYIKGCKEKQEALKEKLKELEMKHTDLRFHQPPNTNRKLEEEMRMYLQREELRLKQMRAQMLRNQELLLKFDDFIDSLFTRLRGMTVPGQDDSVKAKGVEEKFQHCKQKLQYLVQRVADLPPDIHSSREGNETFAKVRNWLEKTSSSDPQNLKVSLEDRDSSVHDTFEFADKGHGLLLTRESIKKQGLQLIEKMKKRK